jgi:hypothetical protein
MYYLVLLEWQNKEARPNLDSTSPEPFHHVGMTHNFQRHLDEPQFEVRHICCNFAFAFLSCNIRLTIPLF